MSAKDKLMVLPSGWRVRLTADRVVAGQSEQEAHLQLFEVVPGNPYSLRKVDDIKLGLAGNQIVENKSDRDQLIAASFFYKDGGKNLRPSHDATNLYQDNTKEKFDVEDLGHGTSFWLLLEKF